MPEVPGEWKGLPPGGPDSPVPLFLFPSAALSARFSSCRQDYKVGARCSGSILAKTKLCHSPISTFLYTHTHTKPKSVLLPVRAQWEGAWIPTHDR